MTYVITEDKTLGLSEIYIFSGAISFASVRHRFVQIATKWCRLAKNWPLLARSTFVGVLYASITSVVTATEFGLNGIRSVAGEIHPAFW